MQCLFIIWCVSNLITSSNRVILYRTRNIWQFLIPRPSFSGKEFQFWGSTLDYIYNIKGSKMFCMHVLLVYMSTFVLYMWYTVYYRGQSGEESYYLMYEVQVRMIKRKIPGEKVSSTHACTQSAYLGTSGVCLCTSTPGSSANGQTLL